ncbi:hypothetical protein [Vibrio mimicus]|uniref:hypothetical protein n=1 Tax=Vibrio mimicus TaxID=674 RepID=UPI0005111F9B|nr:hypothetical protein [Vibrio mimicus]
MSNDWIYVGADINRPNWSKVGKTKKGLNTRHTSSQGPGYFIYTAYKIVNGNVGDIETDLIERYLDSECGIDREVHFSTGSKTECFLLNPDEMSGIVEYFLDRNYPGAVESESLFDGLRRYQCPYEVYRRFQSNLNSSLNSNKPLPTHLRMTRDKYFPSNQVQYEEDLGGGHFVDFETGMQGYRDEDGNIEWKEWD